MLVAVLNLRLMKMKVLYGPVSNDDYTMTVIIVKYIIVMKQVHHNHPGLQVIYSMLTTAALAFVVACLVLNIFFLRRNRLAVLKFAMTELDNITCFSDLKIVSPSLNFLVIGGAALMYVSVYLYVFTADGVLAQTILCNVSITL